MNDLLSGWIPVAVSASNSTQLLYGGHCSVPRDVAVCPECGGTLHADVIGWDAETGLPDIGDVNVDCEADPDCEHRHWQCDWQPVIDAVEKWCGAIEHMSRPALLGRRGFTCYALEADMSTEIENAMNTLKQAMKEDPAYAYSWHANIAMAFYDASGPVVTDSEDHAEQLRIGNEGASRFMKLCFDVETSQKMLEA